VTRNEASSIHAVSYLISGLSTIVSRCLARIGEQMLKRQKVLERKPRCSYGQKPCQQAQGSRCDVVQGLTWTRNDGMGSDILLIWQRPRRKRNLWHSERVMKIAWRYSGNLKALITEPSTQHWHFRASVRLVQPLLLQL